MLGAARLTVIPPSRGLATLNPLDKSPSLGLSLGNLRATSPTIGTVGVRATRAISGNVHFEITVNSGTAGGNPRIGFATAAYGLTTGLNTAGSSALFASGNVTANGSSLGVVGPELLDGNTYAFEANNTTRQWWVQRAGDPTRYGPFDLPPTGDLLPIIYLNPSGSIPQVVTANFGASAWAVTPTAGFGLL